MFNEAEHMSFYGRKESERARDYWDGKQLTEAERNALRKRGQPEITINRVRRKVQWLKGLEIKQRTDPRAYPRTPEDEAAAEPITDGLRYVADNTQFDRVKTGVWDNMLVEGYGGAEVVHRVKRSASGMPEVEIVVNRYPWDRLFYDPHSRTTDFSDARYLGSVIWQDRQALVDEYKGSKPDIASKIEGLSQNGSQSDTYDDKPTKFGQWYDAKRHRVRVVMIWYQAEGEWRWCKFIQGEKLEGGKSPYVNEEGESVCPLILQSLYVDRDNDRYGVIRDMFSPQDEVNKRRSKGLHLLTMRQARMSPGVADKAEISRELAKPDGVVTADADEFDILPTSDLASGQMALLTEAKQELDLMGANSALEGETGSSTSGRAVLARQQGGLIEIEPELDELRHFTQRVFEAMFDRMKQFWTAEKWVRVTDNENAPRFTVLNRPIPFGEVLGQQPPEVAAQVARNMGLFPNDPRLMQPVGVENSIAETNVDIIIEEAPDRITLAGEMFEALLKYGPAIPPHVLIEADPTLPRTKKDQLLELMQQPDPARQLEMEDKAADVAKKQAEAQQIAQQGAMPLALG